MTQYTVGAVYSAWPDAVVGLNLGGDGANVATAYCTGLAYQPQVGDSVDAEKRGTDLVVTHCNTPGRTYPPPQTIPQITVVDTTPGDGWSQGVIWSKDDSPNVFRVVRAAPVTPPTPVGSLTAMSLAGDAGWASYDSTNAWGQRSPAVRQGQIAGLGPAYGFFFYGPTAFAALAGQTISSATVDLVRDDRAGSPWAAKSVLLVAHGYPTVPGGAPSILAGPTAVASLAVKAGARATIPAAIVALLQAGTALGVGIYSASSDDYLALRPAGDTPPGGGDYRNGRCRFTF